MTKIFSDCHLVLIYPHLGRSPPILGALADDFSVPPSNRKCIVVVNSCTSGLLVADVVPAPDAAIAIAVAVTVAAAKFTKFIDECFDENCIGKSAGLDP